MDKKRQEEIVKDLIRGKTIYTKYGSFKILIGVLIILASIGSYLLIDNFNVWWGQLLFVLDALLIIYLFIAYGRVYEGEQKENKEIQEIKNEFSQTIINDTLRENKERTPKGE